MTATPAPTTGAAATSAPVTTGAAGTNSGAALPYAGKTLTVFVYSGLTEDTFRNVFAPIFEKTTGAKLVLSPGW